MKRCRPESVSPRVAGKLYLRRPNTGYSLALSITTATDGRVVTSATTARRRISFRSSGAVKISRLLSHTRVLSSLRPAIYLTDVFFFAHSYIHPDVAHCSDTAYQFL